jgi:hypothetical protein
VTPLLVAVKQKDINTVRALIDWNCRLDIVGRCRVRREDYEFDPFERDDAISTKRSNMPGLPFND